MKRLRGGAALLVAATLTACAPDAAQTPAPVPANVVAVIDGDTIDVAIDSRTVRVRLIGIDSPEIGRGGEASECYADQARDFLDDLLYGTTVQLISDPSQGDQDRYGRLLRHVFIDGKDAAELAIRDGYGTEYTHDTPYLTQESHQVAQRAAAAARAGLWNEC